MAATATATGHIVLRLERRFTAPRERVFDAWTNPEALKRWWCPAGWEPTRIEVDLRVNGAYFLGMRRIEDESTAAVYGQFLEVRRPERLHYTWRWQGALESMAETHVTVDFLDEGAHTRLILTHERLADVALWNKHRAGWIAACDRMDTIL